MNKAIALSAFALAGLQAATPALATPYLCIRTITDVELMHRVKQDAYFLHGTPPSKRLRLENDGCGFRIHVGEGSAHARGGDVLLVDREGRVTRVIHQR